MHIYSILQVISGSLKLMYGSCLAEYKNETKGEKVKF